MANTQAKAHVQTIKLQARERPSMSIETRKTGILHNGVSMIETIISASILVFMTIVFKLINAKQREFDRLEDIRK